MTTRPISPEDRTGYLAFGRQKETEFVWEAAKYGLRVRINPEKEQDPKAPDLVVGEELAELKWQGDPFFKVEEKYGLNPRFTVSFNAKDVRRYTKKFPTLDIYFWIQWTTFSRYGVEVDPLEGVWHAPFPSIIAAMERYSPPLHHYRNRTADRWGNAQGSYLLDLRWFTEIEAVQTSLDLSDL